MIQYPNLLKQWQLGDLKLANRVVMAPMTRARGGDSRMPNDLITEYYAQRASAGLIITEGVHISEQAIGWVKVPGIFTDTQGEAWKVYVLFFIATVDEFSTFSLLLLMK